MDAFVAKHSNKNKQDANYKHFTQAINEIYFLLQASEDKGV